MQVVEKFIINRDNSRFMYVEKLTANFNSIQYRIYYKKNKFQVLYSDTFEITYGNDQQYHINSFVEYMKTDLLCNCDNSKNMMKLISDLDLISNRFNLIGRFNPNLYGYNDTLLSAIDLYNDIISKRPKDEEYDYQKDLEVLSKDNDTNNVQRVYKLNDSDINSIL